MYFAFDLQGTGRADIPEAEPFARSVWCPSTWQGEVQHDSAHVGGTCRTDLAKVTGSSSVGWVRYNNLHHDNISSSYSFTALLFMLVMSGSEWYHGMLSDQSFSLRGPGHSWITHSFLLKGEELPVCIGCDELLTYEHILLTCSDFIEIRESHFTAKW